MLPPMRLVVVCLVVVVAATVGSESACAGTIHLTFTEPLSSSAESSGGSSVQFSVSGSTEFPITVNDGDTVIVDLLFADNETFELLHDLSNPDIEAEGRLLLADSEDPGYDVTSGFSFSLLDSAGSSLLSESEGSAVRGGGDLIGDVTLTQTTDLNVGGFTIEFSSILDSPTGGELPVVFDGARFQLTSVQLDDPFGEETGGEGGGETNGEPTPIPEPSSLILLVTGVVGLVGYGWRRRRMLPR